MPLKNLEKIRGFSSAKYEELSPYFHLNPSAYEEDVGRFQFDRVFIAADLFETVMIAMRFYQAQFGLLFNIFNEDPCLTSSRWYVRHMYHLSALVLGATLTLFNGGLLNNPDLRMTGQLASSRRVEITLFRRCVHRRTVSTLDRGSRLKSENELKREWRLKAEFEGERFQCSRHLAGILPSRTRTREFIDLSSFLKSIKFNRIFVRTKFPRLSWGMHLAHYVSPRGLKAE